MAYSINAILHNSADKKDLHKLQIQIIYNRSKVYIKTDFKVRADQFSNGLVVNHPNQEKINANIRKQITVAESKLIEALRDGLTTENFKTLFKGQEVITVNVYDYMDDLIKRLDGKCTKSYCQQLRVIAEKIDPYISFAGINVAWLQGVEKGLRDSNLDANTIHSQMKRLKSLLYYAAEEGFFDINTISKYKVPVYRQKLVDFLTESEIADFEKVLSTVKDPARIVAGYYFLLSCYAGWRISDIKTFDEEKIIGDRIVVRVKKNKQIVSIPIHSRLKKVLVFTRLHAFNLDEQSARNYVREIASLAGIQKRISGYHTGRHTFAMLLMANDFNRDEVAELIGDTPLITKVYARIHNEVLDKKVREKLG